MDSEESKPKLSDEQIAQMNMSGWISQMSSIWHIHQHVFVAEAATLTGWYLLYSESKFVAANALLLIINILFYIAIFIVKRSYQITAGMNKTLQDLGVFRNKPQKGADIFKHRKLKDKLPKLNHQIARLVILVLIFINLILSFASFSCYSLVFSVLSFIVFLGLILRWHELFLDTPDVVDK